MRGLALGGELEGNARSFVPGGSGEVTLQLSGSANPYTGRLATGTANGNWAIAAETFTTQVYVLNDPGGLAGKIVRAWLDHGGVSRAAYPRWKPPVTCTLNLNVQGCKPTPGFVVGGTVTGQQVAGAEINATIAGVSYGPVLTDSAGNASIPIATLGTGTMTVTAPAAGMATVTGSVDLSTCFGGVKSIQVNMGAATDHVCCPASGLSGQASCRGVAIPKTLTLTSPFGTTTLQWYATAPWGFDFGTAPPIRGGWWGCQRATAPGIQTSPCDYAASVEFPIWWNFNCSFAPNYATDFLLAIWYPQDSCSGTGGGLDHSGIADHPPGSYSTCPSAPASINFTRDEILTSTPTARAASSCSPLAVLYDGANIPHFISGNGPAVDFVPVTVSL
jgi:hypothetical protein